MQSEHLPIQSAETAEHSDESERVIHSLGSKALTGGSSPVRSPELSTVELSSEDNGQEAMLVGPQDSGDGHTPRVEAIERTDKDITVRIRIGDETRVMRRERVDYRERLNKVFSPEVSNSILSDKRLSADRRLQLLLAITSQFKQSRGRSRHAQLTQQAPSSEPGHS